MLEQNLLNKGIGGTTGKEYSRIRRFSLGAYPVYFGIVFFSMLFNMLLSFLHCLTDESGKPDLTDALKYIE